MLPTLDGFERALQHRDESVPAAFYEGLELIYRELREVLGRAGLSPIDTAGQMFDPHLHQAVETVNDPGLSRARDCGGNAARLQDKNKLLRPAIVKVAVGGSPAQDRADQS